MLQGFQLNSLCSSLKIERTQCQATGLIPFLFQCHSSASAGKPGDNHQEWEIFECTGNSAVPECPACQHLPGAEACTDLLWSNTKLFQGVFVLCCRVWILLSLINVEVCAKTKCPWGACPMENSLSTLVSCWQWGELGQGKVLDENQPNPREADPSFQNTQVVTTCTVPSQPIA